MGDGRMRLLSVTSCIRQEYVSQLGRDLFFVRLADELSPILSSNLTKDCVLTDDRESYVSSMKAHNRFEKTNFLDGTERLVKELLMKFQKAGP